MSLDPPTYLNSLQNNIRARPIPWEGAVRTGNITDQDLKKIKAVDKVRKEQRRQTVEADVAAYRSLLLGGENGKSVLESAAKKPDVVQYILVLTGDLLNGSTLRDEGYCVATDTLRQMSQTLHPPFSTIQTHTSPSCLYSLTHPTQKIQYRFSLLQSLQA